MEISKRILVFRAPGHVVGDFNVESSLRDWGEEELKRRILELM